LANNLAIRSDGSLMAWGMNDFSQCNVPDGNDFVAIEGGGTHSLAIRAFWLLLVWGNISHGRCDVLKSDKFLAIVGGWYLILH